MSQRLISEKDLVDLFNTLPQAQDGCSDAAHVCSMCPNNRNVVCAYCEGSGIVESEDGFQGECPQGCLPVDLNVFNVKPYKLFGRYVSYMSSSSPIPIGTKLKIATESSDKESCNVCSHSTTYCGSCGTEMTSAKLLEVEKRIAKLEAERDAWMNVAKNSTDTAEKAVNDFAKMRDENHRLESENKKLRDWKSDHIQYIDMYRNEIKTLKETKFMKFNNDECWIYQEDGDNRLETLTCPVVISPARLLELEKGCKS